MRSLLAAGIALGLLLPASASAETKTFGADLSRPADNTRTCETGFFDPALIAGTGFPYEPYDSCTWWSAGGIQGTGSAIVPYGGGTVRRVRVKVGPITGRMQVVALRLMRHPASLADPACCFPAGSGPVFTPAAGAITELAVDIPVKHETDPATGIVNYDILALSVLDDGVPMPATLTGDGGWGGIVAGMFPAYVPGEERTVGYGSIAPGHVLLQADVEAVERPVAPALSPTPVDSSAPTPTQTPTHIPTAADATLGSDRAAVRRGAARVRVTCNAAAGCTGALRLARGRRVLGRAQIRMAAGSTRTVRVALSRHGRRFLRYRRAVTALATLRLGNRTVVRRSLTLTVAARRR